MSGPMITPTPAYEPSEPRALVSLSPLATSARVAVAIVLPEIVESVLREGRGQGAGAVGQGAVGQGAVSQC
jgi:hypothetical protein